MGEREKDIDITTDELEKIKNAMKNEEFRKMFMDYAKEISDPENKKKYEAEIAQMEAERGMDVKFINPEDGFVVKTSMKNKDGKKIFINICQSDMIAEASSTFVKKENSERSGHQWSIPYSLTQPREDIDKAGKHCTVCDVVFNPKTYKKSVEDPRFKKLMTDTAFEAIEREWKLKLDHKNLKFPKMTFKGTKQSTVIRNPNMDNKSPKAKNDDIVIGDHRLPYPYKENNLMSNAKAETGAKLEKPDPCLKPEKPDSSAKPEKPDATPEYSIVHRGHLDLQNFTNARDCRSSTRPRELVVHIDLPLCKSSAGVDLDIFEKQLVLDSVDPLYHLDIVLPYPVIESEGNAKFDKSKRRLTVILPVQPCAQSQLPNPDVTTVSEDSEPDEGDNIEDCQERVTDSESHVDTSCDEIAKENPEELVGQESNGVFDSINDKPCPFFITPTYSYHQDSHTVTFVLQACGVSIDTVSLGFTGNKCSISFPASNSESPSLANPDYALYIEFPEDCAIDGDSSKIDSNEQNIVLILHKQRGGLWTSFQIGSREEKLVKKLFLTEENLAEALKQNQDKWIDNDTCIKSHRVEQGPEQLNIELEVAHDTGDHLEIKPGESASLNGEEGSCEEVGCSVENAPIACQGVEAAPESGVGGTSSEGCTNDLEEVEVVEEGGLTTVQEVEGVTPGVDGGEANTAELQKARILKCKKNRRRRRRSTGSHESSSVSEEEGAEGGQRKLSGKQARRLRKTRSLSLGSSAESHDDDAEYGSLDTSRSVRFNLVPQIRVFSNRADKRKWKEKRKQGDDVYSGSWPAAERFPSKSALKDARAATRPWRDHDDNEEKERENVFNDDELDSSGVQDQLTSYKLNDEHKPYLTNQLIFDLDD